MDRNQQGISYQLILGGKGGTIMETSFFKKRVGSPETTLGIRFDPQKEGADAFAFRGTHYIIATPSRLQGHNVKSPIFKLAVLAENQDPNIGAEMMHTACLVFLEATASHRDMLEFFSDLGFEEITREEYEALGEFKIIVILDEPG